MSESQEIDLGRQYDSQVQASIGLYPDADWQRDIQRLGERLASGRERPNRPWTFRVVDDAAVNAFALPGGFVYVTRGLLAHLNSEAELAAVVGHEIGHITARHFVSRMSSRQLAGLGAALGSGVGSKTSTQPRGADMALGLLVLKHSRDAEMQADELGLRNLVRTDWDPREMPDVFRMLESVDASEGGGELAESLATHPSPRNRREHMTAEIASLRRDFSGAVVNRDSYLRRLDGQVFGPDPREGYFVGARFLHPELRFQLVFPEGWSTVNGKQAVVGASPAMDAVVELSRAPEKSAAGAARAFLGQEGIGAGATSNANLRHFRAVTAPFSAATRDGTLRGTALFIEHAGAIFRLLGYAPDHRWSADQPAVDRVLRSFQPLIDPAMLSVRPHRIEIFRMATRTTIEELARRKPSPASDATLALINQIGPQTTLEPGRLLKWVVGRSLDGQGTAATPRPPTSSSVRAHSPASRRCTRSS